MLTVRLSIVLSLTLSACALGRETPSAIPTTNPAAAFYHPGVLVNRAQLELIKSKVAGGAEPWKSAFEAAKSSEYGTRSYTPHPR